MRQYQKLSKFWQGKNIKTSVFRTCILITSIKDLRTIVCNSKFLYIW